MNYKRDIFYLADRMRLIEFNEENIYLQARYGPSKIIKLPLKINEDLSCFMALIIGDGHLSKYKFRTTIESSSRELLSSISKMSKSLFRIRIQVKKVKKIERKKQTYLLSIYSKAVQELLSIVFEMPRGEKSNFVKIPEKILAENNRIKKTFIIGLLAAEGSRKGKYNIRICSASKQLLLDTQKNIKKVEYKE